MSHSWYKLMVMLISVASLKILQTVISDVEQGFWFFIEHTEIFWCREPASLDYDSVLLKFVVLTFSMGENA